MSRCECELCQSRPEECIKIGKALGYPQCCIDNWLEKEDVFDPQQQDKLFKEAIARAEKYKDVVDWIGEQRRAGRFVFWQEYLRFRVRETGLKDFLPCKDCKYKLLKWAIENGENWSAAVKKLLKGRRFPLDYTPKKNELL